ncbi:ankyrin repeat and SOCS box protein 11 [Chanos chanos]|uniref:Ankyrin repeat and SOCS box protein 11 n=1 Tax=Chanos chanos TaxID=29144 RepID=A0A6J2WAE2_CHACN|nr:ankyrin repeat and SOCS box protein 5-like [Chanos chanos]
MAAIQPEVCIQKNWWEQQFNVYGGQVCNAFMAGSWADRTPLHEAALQGRLLPLKRLLSQGFHVDVVTLDGITPLHEACLGGHLTCAKLLLEHGANAEAVSVDGVTPLFSACCSGNSSLVSLILNRSSILHPAHLLRSPLHEAAKRGHTDCVELLISHGVDADMELAEVGTPLYCACENRSTECVQRLLVTGVNVQCGRGLDTPLHAAARVGGFKVVELLLEHGADGNCRNSEGKKAADLASNDSIRKLLLTADPVSLVQLCRLCVRRSLGIKRINRIKALYLPESIYTYLLYQ